MFQKLYQKSFFFLYHFESCFKMEKHGIQIVFFWVMNVHNFVFGRLSVYKCATKTQPFLVKRAYNDLDPWCIIIRPESLNGRRYRPIGTNPSGIKSAGTLFFLNNKKSVMILVRTFY